MKPTQLPPLGTLIAFEAAAEYGSFASAAKKLFVTPAAISQKIQVLEQHLGVVLFDRSKMGVKLTHVGENYLVFVQKGLEKLRLGQQQIKQFSNPDVLTITTLPSVATKWLMPHVLQWMDLNPGLEIRIEASHKKVDFNQSASDICICFGDQDYLGFIQERLFTDSVSLVISPTLLESVEHSDDEKTYLQSILKLPMIHVDWGDHNDNLPDWNDWLDAVDLNITAPNGGPHFNLSSMAIEAALQSRGLLLGQQMLINTELKSGQLVKLYDINLPLKQSYFIAYPKRTLNNPNAVAFINWLKSR
ncbi:MAG: LysR substrate-binding domain-containing protein [Marinomonas colpomeniae]